MYHHVPILWIKYCQWFKNFICDGMHCVPFRSGLTAVNEYTVIRHNDK